MLLACIDNSDSWVNDSITYSACNKYSSLFIMKKYVN